jgi:hypothetical protein
MVGEHEARTYHDEHYAIHCRNANNERRGAAGTILEEQTLRLHVPAAPMMINDCADREQNFAFERCTV